MTFGERLRQKRLEAGITQTKIARELEVSVATVCGWEADVKQPRLARCADLADLLHCTIDELVRDGPDKNPEM